MKLPELAIDDFPAFFKAVQGWDERDGWTGRGHDPFPWQVRLVREIVERRRWPDLLDLPTGSGKTATIDIAVFHLALEADKAERRCAAMRIALVVDRRLVVDDAYRRAKKLGCALDAAAKHAGAPSAVRVVAERLCFLAGINQPPLAVVRLRGGVPRENDWAQTPCQPTVLSSTVDQVGSRLLFRGYGVSDSMKPVHAGLLGSDALILLDEAHLSEPFRQTARAIATIRSVRGPDRTPLDVALLTATPGEDESADAWRFRLGDDDRVTRVLSDRLTAAKPAMLNEIAPDEEARATALAEHAIRLVRELQANGVAAPIIGVVANRVARARAVFASIQQTFGAEGAVLVIGRARPIERDRIAEALTRIRTGVNPRPENPCVVVATQTIEVGVDLDLDALVTDAASLDALRQRFGRVNRAGRQLDGRGFPARGVILADRTDRKPEKNGDPIYGIAIARTLESLFPNGGETVDFGVQALDRLLERAKLTGRNVLPLMAEKPDAPVLMPAYVELWTHTSPTPSADPEPGLFLHGAKREPASVQVVWRADLDFDRADEQLNARLCELLSLSPPRSTETLELPVWSVRCWLAGSGADLADVDQVRSDDASESSKRRVFRWCGRDSEKSRVILPNAIRSGDVIVVPSSYGGCDEYGWNPDELLWTDDLFEEASTSFRRKRYTVRVSPGLIEQALIQDGRAKLGREPDCTERERIRTEAARYAVTVETALHGLGPSPSAVAVLDVIESRVPHTLAAALRRLRAARRGRFERPAFPYSADENNRPGVVLTASYGINEHEGDTKSGRLGEALPMSEDDEAASFVGNAKSLSDHSRAVSQHAKTFAVSIGLEPKLVDDIALAAWLHDAGKADTRFQLLLADGDPFAMEETGAVLAKSARGRLAGGARERANLPDRWRHEALSVRLAVENPRLQEAYDRALVLWLIGTHHGWGRPFFPHSDPLDSSDRCLPSVDKLVPAVLAAGTGPQSLGFVLDGVRFGPTERDASDLCGLDWSALFRVLNGRYGAWGLARLEAVLRLADHRASAIGAEVGGGT